MYTNIVQVSGQVEVTMFRPPVLEPFFVVAGRAERFRPASRQRIWFFSGGNHGKLMGKPDKNLDDCTHRIHVCHIW